MALTSAPWMQNGGGAQGFRDTDSRSQKPQIRVGWADLGLGRGLLGSAGSRAVLDRGGPGRGFCLCWGPQAWRHAVLCI